MGIDEENKIKRLKAENNRLKKQMKCLKDKSKQIFLKALWYFCIIETHEDINKQLDRENKILRIRIKKLIRTCRELKDHIKKNEELGRLAKRIIEERIYYDNH